MFRLATLATFAQQFLFPEIMEWGREEAVVVEEEEEEARMVAAGEE
jgi:hypothetical protein